MPKPTPTLDQLEALNSEIAGNTEQSNAIAQSVPLQDPIIEQKQKVDDAFKALFNYYNDSIIKKYDAERKALNGSFIANPIGEADLIAVASNPISGRLAPTPPAVDIVRIPEFDGTAYTSIDPINEQQLILDQEDIEDVLQNGYGPGSYPTSLETKTALTPTSTTLQLEDASSPISGIAAGTVFLVIDGGDLAVVKVLTATPVTSPPPPPYVLNLTIELIVPPSGTISAGANLYSFTGFTNSERTNKTASNPDFQPLMDYLISILESKINDRISKLNDQLSAVTSNEDPDAVAELASAASNINASSTFLTNYLLTTDISNTGLASLASERGTRAGQVTARLAEILAAYTGQTEDYYEQRYQIANTRGNTQRGTLRLLENAKNVKATLQDLNAGLLSANAALSSIIP
jgi:hypothetical protein